MASPFRLACLKGEAIVSHTNVLLRCSVVVFSADRVLLIHRRDHDDWALPGGTPRPGEDLLTCARREVREETGMVLDPGTCVFIIETVRPYSARLIDLVFLSRTSPAGQPRCQEDGLTPVFVPLTELGMTGLPRCRIGLIGHNGAGNPNPMIWAQQGEHDVGLAGPGVHLREFRLDMYGRQRTRVEYHGAAQPMIRLVLVESGFRNAPVAALPIDDDQASRRRGADVLTDDGVEQRCQEAEPQRDRARRPPGFLDDGANGGLPVTGRDGCRRSHAVGPYRALAPA